MHRVWYSQPASEEHPITPNRPLRNFCIWQQCGEREINYTLETRPGGPDALFRDQ